MGWLRSIPLSSRESGLCALYGNLSLRNQDELFSRFRATCPESLVEAVWSRYGPSGFDEFRGQFSFVLQTGSCLVCARDHLGQEPFYYTVKMGLFTCSNRFELLVSELDGTDVNIDYLCAHVLEYPYYHPAQTFCKGVYKLAPGHYLTIDASGLQRSSPFWRPEQIQEAFDPPTLDIAIENARELCRETVRESVGENKKVGVHLSGGLDCSSIAGLAFREVPSLELVPLSWLPNEAGAEQGRVEAVARMIGAPVHYHGLTPEALAEFFWLNPFRVPVERTLSQEMPVQRYASGLGVDCILSGWGGDEGLTTNQDGYLTGLLLSLQWQKLFAIFKRSERPWRAAKGFLRSLIPIDSAPLRDPRRFARRWARRKNLIGPALALRQRRFRRPWARPTSVKDRITRALQSGYLAQRVEVWAEFGEHQGVRYEYPFLDKRFFEMVLALPESYFWHQDCPRWFGRKVLEPFLPPEVCWNLDKGEPTRHHHNKDVTPIALKLIEKQLRLSTPANSHLFDYKALMRSLSALDRDEVGLLSAIVALETK